MAPSREAQDRRELTRGASRGLGEVNLDQWLLQLRRSGRGVSPLSSGEVGAVARKRKFALSS